jgi:hypothetical protein
MRVERLVLAMPCRGVPKKPLEPAWAVPSAERTLHPSGWHRTSSGWAGVYKRRRGSSVGDEAGRWWSSVRQRCSSAAASLAQLSGFFSLCKYPNLL